MATRAIPERPRARITGKERDAIIAALRDDPQNVEGIALRFGRGASTVLKLRQTSGVGRPTLRDRLRRGSE